MPFFLPKKNPERFVLFIPKDLYYFLIKFIHAVVFKRGKLKHAGGRAFVLQVGIKCTCSCT